MRTTGWIVFIGALGMLFGLMSLDVAKLADWTEATKPLFVASILGHIAVVITAFIGGKIIPEDRPVDMRTRAQDKVDEAKTKEEKE